MIELQGKYAIRWTFDAKSKEHPVKPIGVSYISANPTVVHETCYTFLDGRWTPVKPGKVALKEQCYLVELNFSGNQQSITIAESLDDLNINGVGIFETAEAAREQLRSYSV